ncbi:MAG: hypothetical protein ABFS41_03085 [Myxococcota bacterium]
MARHPLVERSRDARVRQARGFREAAAELTGEQLAADFEVEREGAPRRSEARKKHLVQPNQRLMAERKAGRDAEHAALALLARREKGGGPLRLPDEEGFFEPLHAGVVLKSAPADPKAGAEDPNFGIDRVDLVGVGPDDRMAIVMMRFVAPSGTRVGTGETPLRALLDGLAHTAVAVANQEALAAEIEAKTERKLSDAKPYLFLLGSQRYWELCRKREAQKGAAWIQQMERLAREFEEQTGIGVRYLALKVQGDPGWSYGEGRPEFDEEVRIGPAWEPGAGRIKPKARPSKRRSSATPTPTVVEPDLSRPVRDYRITEHYVAGDRIQHPTLGAGVVQGIAGPGKITVHFDERRSVLVHDRAAPSA